MAKMSNTENNISFIINLLNNNSLDIKRTRDNCENWIPFELFLNVDGEEYNYSSEARATFTLFELRRLLNGLQELISRKQKGHTIEKFEFYSSEAYFDIIFYDPLEENMISVEVWIKIGTYTNGKSFGYNKGFQFEVYLDNLEAFTAEMKEQLERIISSLS